MKQLTLTYTRSSLRFRQWSRKGYAAFISIQRAVTIGHLAAHVTDRFQTKNESLHTCLVAASSETTATGETAGEGTAQSLPKADPAATGLLTADLFAKILFCLLPATCKAGRHTGKKPENLPASHQAANAVFVRMNIEIKRKITDLKVGYLPLFYARIFSLSLFPETQKNDL